MKKHQCYHIVIVLLAFASCKNDMQETTEMTTETTITSTAILTDEVEQTLVILNNAMLDRSATALDSICSEQLSYGHSSGNVQTKAEFIDEVMNGSYDYTSILMPELSISVSGETAIARFIFDIKGIKDEEPQAVRLGCVQVFQKQNGQWKLLMRQAYKI